VTSRSSVARDAIMVPQSWFGITVHRFSTALYPQD
jgi:hypothetical protein